MHHLNYGNAHLVPIDDDTTLTAILQRLAVLGTVMDEVRADVKETKAQAIATNGRVNGHDTVLDVLAERMQAMDERLAHRIDALEAAAVTRRAAGWQVATWVVGPVSGAIGALLAALVIALAK